MAKTKQPTPPQSPQAKLAAVIKSARDAMRKDAGLNGDLDRIPQLAWLLFLKAFDGLEQDREVTEADYRPAIEEPYRWRDWAADPDGRTGEALLDFVNGELLPYLRGLVGTHEHDPRDVLAAVFRETYNRMLSGHLLRDVVNKVSEINFTSSDDIHTMAHLYESMLREMRDAAGDSGEFYTPRPVIRFMVHQVDPKLGEIVLDPACGTGGFLVEALEHLRPQVRTVQEGRDLQGDLRGVEKKPLPYLLGMMNLLLHRVGQPNIVRGNALARPITQISKRDRVDVILTNPPFGGEEEKTIQANFPADKQTAETAWLFLQLVIRQLKEGGRCAVVVPNGLLFAGGVGARIKQQLVTECNLHTVVRLPDGVFEPYTAIPANVLFFEKTGRTKEVWYYEIPAPEGRKKYSKTRPMRFEEFADCQEWWSAREANERAWRVPIADLELTEFNLDLRNPSRPDDLAHRPPAELIGELIENERAILELLERLHAEVEHGLTAHEMVCIGEVLRLERREVVIDVTGNYEEIGVRSFGRGIFHKEPVDGASLGSKRLFRIEPGDLVISNVFAWEGAIAVASPAERGKIGSHRFMTFVPRDGRIDTSWAAWFFLSEPGLELIRKASPGSAGRNKTLAVKRFNDLVVPLPTIEEQHRVVAVLEQATRASAHLSDLIRRAADLALAAELSMATPPSTNGSPIGWEEVAIGDVVAASDARVAVEDSAEYRIAGTYSFGKGLIDRGRLYGAETSYKVLTRLEEGNIVVSKLNGWEGAVAVVDRAFHHTHVSSEYPSFVVDESRMLPGFFRGIARSPAFWRDLDQSVRGSMVRRRRLSASDFMRALIWLPPLDQQIRVSRAIDDLERAIERSTQSAARTAAIVPALLNREFGAIK